MGVALRKHTYIYNTFILYISCRFGEVGIPCELRHVRRTLLIVATFNVHHSLKATVHLRLEFLELHQLTFGRTLGGLTPTNGNISNLLPCKNVRDFSKQV